jgi:mRNA interferase RelE/StbE
LDSKADRRRIVEKIAGLAENPRGQGAEKLAGYEDRYRVPQGDYRIVYLIDDETTTVTIYRVAHWKDVYR